MPLCDDDVKNIKAASAAEQCVTVYDEINAVGSYGSRQIVYSVLTSIRSGCPYFTAVLSRQKQGGHREKWFRRNNGWLLILRRLLFCVFEGKTFRRNLSRYCIIGSRSGHAIGLTVRREVDPIFMY
jgi:hypothetical protein